jgi:hypothetical protein
MVNSALGLVAPTNEMRTVRASCKPNAQTAHGQRMHAWIAILDPAHMHVAALRSISAQRSEQASDACSPCRKYDQ